MDYEFFSTLLTQRKRVLRDSMIEKGELMEQWYSSKLSDDSDVVAAALYETKVANILELQKTEIDDIDYALTKIKNKTYGICEMCDDEIDIERLKIKPHARYCIDCREDVEKRQILEQKMQNLKKR
ncbi:RNA polymerase-binding protein DksA [uncultured Helicobacter sp.]|uniref:RNA polymerase-binding protein DksA n=1 Tax=uncultured Helicobacter sp. TaxID=175537 RepID=UPI0037509001